MSSPSALPSSHPALKKTLQNSLTHAFFLCWNIFWSVKRFSYLYLIACCISLKLWFIDFILRFCDIDPKTYALTLSLPLLALKFALFLLKLAILLLSELYSAISTRMRCMFWFFLLNTYLAILFHSIQTCFLTGVKLYKDRWDKCLETTCSAAHLRKCIFKDHADVLGYAVIKTSSVSNWNQIFANTVIVFFFYLYPQCGCFSPLSPCLIIPNRVVLPVRLSVWVSLVQSCVTIWDSSHFCSLICSVRTKR